MTSEGRTADGGGVLDTFPYKPFRKSAHFVDRLERKLHVGTGDEAECRIHKVHEELLEGSARDEAE